MALSRRWHGRFDDSDTDGWSCSWFSSDFSVWNHHQVYPLPYRCGIYQWYRRNHLHDPDQGSLWITLTSNPSDFLEKWGVYFQSFDTIDPWCALIGVVSVVVIAITPKFSKKIPGSLIAIILMTVVALLLKQFAGVESIETIGDRFSISNELPAAQVPAMNWETIKSLVSPAITIAILGAIESLLSAIVADGVISDHHDSNTELVAQGFAISPLPLWRYSCNRCHCPHNDQYQ